MKIRVVAKFLGFFSAIITMWMLCPIAYSLIFSRSDLLAFWISFSSGIALSAVLYFWGSRADMSGMGVREALASVSLAWVIASSIGGLPYYIYGAVPDIASAFFEAMSGFTTTGATVLEDIDAVPRGLLLWRAITHWLGGMGIIVLTLTVMPMVGAGGYNLYAAEVPGFDNDRMTPRVRTTAVILWLIYLGMTAVLCAALYLSGMTFYDALTHALATISTGGFSPHNNSMAYFDSPTFDWIITLFMFMSGVNFALYYQMIRGRSLRSFYKDAEFGFYTVVTLIASLLIGCSLYASGTFETIADCARHAVFQSSSFITTTGFLSANYDSWGEFPKAVLFVCFLLGGCTGSTAGGFKQVRILILLKLAARRMKQNIHPRAVIPIRIGGSYADESIVSSTMSFLGLYVILVSVSIFLVALFEDDYMTAISGVLTTIGNVGPGFGRLGASFNFAPQHWVAKWIYSFLMLAGRLEMFTVILLFTRTFWKDGVDLSDGYARQTVQTVLNRQGEVLS